MPNKTLDSGIEPETQRLKDALGGQSTEDMEIIGYGVMYTVGADWNCLVPREWLLQEMNDIGLPEWMAPSKPTPSSGYKRMVQRMNNSWLDEYEIMAPRLDDPDVREPHRVTVDIKEGDNSHIHKVRAEIFFPENESTIEGGDWVQHKLGTFSYNKDTQSFYSSMNESIDSEHDLYPVWEDVSDAGQRLFHQMQETYTARDIRKIMYYLINKWTNNTIKLRRSVYLFPAGMADTVEKMSKLYSSVNDSWKRTGEPVAVRTFEVLNTDDKQEWVAHKVKETLRDNLDTILDSAFDELDEGETSDQVVGIIQDNLGQSAETAEVYNSMLEMEIAVEEVLEERRAEVADEEREEIIDRVMEETDLDE